jgi:hypothetical protein
MKPNLIIENSSGHVRAYIKGELTIRYHKEVKDVFVKLVDLRPQSVVIDEPESVDLVFLQLWWAFLKNCRDSGSMFSVTSRLPQSEEQLLKKLNLISLLQ